MPIKMKRTSAGYYESANGRYRVINNAVEQNPNFDADVWFVLDEDDCIGERTTKRAAMELLQHEGPYNG